MVVSDAYFNVSMKIIEEITFLFRFLAYGNIQHYDFKRFKTKPVSLDFEWSMPKL